MTRRGRRSCRGRAAAGASPGSRELPPFETIPSVYLRPRPWPPMPCDAHRRPSTPTTCQGSSGSATASRGTAPSALPRHHRLGLAVLARHPMCDTALLTAQPAGSGSLYSLARELTVAPARPAASFVPAGSEEVSVAARALVGQPWLTRTLRTPNAWRPLLTAVNALPVDTRGAHGCRPTSAPRVRFVTAAATRTFSADPACQSRGGRGAAAGRGHETLARRRCSGRPAGADRPL